jgi:hypothetical protein
MTFKTILNNIKSVDYHSIFQNILNDYIKFPLYILTHPFKGYDDFKLEKKGKLSVAIVYLLLLVITNAISVTASGFLVSAPYVENFSIVRTFFLVVVPVVLITIGNWSITSLFEGKGKMIEIFKVICYAVIPLVWIGIPMTIVSNFLIQEELAIYTAMNAIAVFFVGYMAIFGLLVIHEYGLLKTIVTMAFTAVAVALIIFIGLLILTLFQQLYGFIIQVYEEFIMRLS